MGHDATSQFMEHGDRGPMTIIMKVADDRWEVVCPWPQPTGPRWPSPALYDEYRWGTSGNKYTRDVMDAGYFIDLMTRIPNHFSKEVVPT